MMKTLRPVRKTQGVSIAAIALALVLAVGGCPWAPLPSNTEKTFMLPGDVPLEMVWIPAGTFMMGRYPGEQDSQECEDPQHQVTVPGFWMGKYELTKAQWTAITGTAPWTGQEHVLDDPKSPAVCVSWNDAKAFIRALTSYTGTTFRLPSEAEWEYACRAGTTTRFYWGDAPEYTLCDAYCWCECYANFDDACYAHGVGQKLPNAFGLYDMSGNAMEWCEDDWHYWDVGYIGAPTDGTAWVELPRLSMRILRGGSWINHPIATRSACRACVGPSTANGGIGFRVAM